MKTKSINITGFSAEPAFARKIILSHREVTGELLYDLALKTDMSSYAGKESYEGFVHMQKSRDRTNKYTMSSITRQQSTKG